MARGQVDPGSAGSAGITSTGSTATTPLLLYSGNTLLAFRINELYYRGRHYAWCSPYFNAQAAPTMVNVMPTAATPFDICRTLLEDVTRRNHQSTKISRVKVGILHGASKRRQTGLIGRREEREIQLAVTKAAIEDFRPLLYVIPYQPIHRLVQTVPMKRRAHPFSPEYIVDALEYPAHFGQIPWGWEP